MEWIRQFQKICYPLESYVLLVVDDEFYDKYSSRQCEDMSRTTYTHNA